MIQTPTNEECEIIQKEEQEWTKNELTSDIYKESAGNVNLTQGEDHGCTKNEVCVQNTTSSLNLGQGCIIKETPATTQEGECCPWDKYVIIRR